MFRRSNNRRPAPEIDRLAWLLVFDVIQRIAALEHKPPVTISLMAFQAAVYFRRAVLPLPWLHLLNFVIPEEVGDVCLQPASIVGYGEWSRIYTSAFVHADAIHLYYNMLSLLWKGYKLERRMGSKKFFEIIVALTFISHTLIFTLAVFLAPVLPSLYYQCSVGFSAVLFALKVILQHNEPGYSEVMGMVLPTKYLSWAELVLISLTNPQASFFGHLCGILGGWLYIYALKYYMSRRRGGR